MAIRAIAADPPGMGYAAMTYKWNSGRIQAQGTPVPYLKITVWQDAFSNLNYLSSDATGVAAFKTAIQNTQNWQFWEDSDVNTIPDPADTSVAPATNAKIYRPYSVTLTDTPGTLGLSSEFAVTVIFNTYNGCPPKDKKILFRVLVPDKNGKPNWVTSYYKPANGPAKTFTVSALPQSAGIDADITSIKFPTHTTLNDGTTTNKFNVEVPIGFHVTDFVNPYNPSLGWLAHAVDVNFKTQGVLAAQKDDVGAYGEAHLTFSRRLNPTYRDPSTGNPSTNYLDSTAGSAALKPYPIWKPDSVTLDTVVRSNEVATRQFGGGSLRLDKTLLGGTLPNLGNFVNWGPGLGLSAETDSGSWWKKTLYTDVDNQHASRSLLYYSGTISTNHIALLPDIFKLNHDAGALPWERGLSLDGSFQHWWMPNETGAGGFAARKSEEYRSLTVRLPLRFLPLVFGRVVGFSVTLQHGSNVGSNFAAVDTHPQYGLFLFPSYPTK